MAVVPSSSNERTNEQVKQYIENSFSDETNVVPDASGESGVIKPVFKEHDAQDYLYVMVTLKGKK